ncbi:MAG: hypothetical protein ACRDWI_00705 [Jiangellaceae bacterium]
MTTLSTGTIRGDLPWDVFAYADGMDVVSYLGTVVAICALAIGAMYVIVGLLGTRIDDLRVDMNGRFDGLRQEMDARFDGLRQEMDARFDTVDARFGASDDRFSGIEGRLTRLETQNDSIIDAVADLGRRVARIEEK